MADKDQVLASFLHGDMSPFLNLLQNLMNRSNAERAQAEKFYESCKEFPSELVLRLLEVIQAPQNSEVRGLSAILLRKLITRDGVMPKLSIEARTALKSQLLDIIYRENDGSIGKKLCDAVGELAINILEDGTWPELLPCVSQWLSGQQDRLKECALLILGQIADYVTSNAGAHLVPLLTIIDQCLRTSPNIDVRVAALQSASEFIFAVEGNNKESLKGLLPGMIEAITATLNSKNELAAEDAMKVFVNIAEIDPKFLKSHLADIVNLALQVAQTADLSGGLRHLSLEFLVTLMEAREQAPGILKKVPFVYERLFGILLHMLLDIEDFPEWYTNSSDDGDTENYDLANEYLDRMAMSLQGNILLPIASQLLPQFLADADWKKRHAALIAMGQIAEGCSKVMLNSLDTIVTMVLSAFRDPFPRVRYAAINAIAQLCLDLGPDLQEKHHQSVIPALITAMDETGFPRIQAHSVAAMLNYAEETPEEGLKPYMDAIVSKLLMLLQTGNLMVQEGTVTALAAVADSAKEEFVKYYDAVMPFLKTILMTFSDKERRTLRCKAMECISLVGLAVGKEKFRNDAKEVIDVLMQLENSKLEEDDPLASYMLQAWARLCKCLGSDFLPLMPVVMPSVFRIASMKPDVSLLDSDDEEDEEDEEVEVISVGNKRMAIRTSILEEKATACSMLCCYAEELKEGFFPWIDEVAQLMVPLFKFYFHEDVRKAAVQSVPFILLSAKAGVEIGMSPKGPIYYKELFDFMINPLVSLLTDEPENDVLVEFLESLSEVIQNSSDQLTPDQVKEIVSKLKEVTIKSHKNREQRVSRYEADELDENEKSIIEDDNALDDAVYEQVGEVVGSLIKSLKQNFIPYFDEIVPYMLPLLAKTVSSEERRITICMFDDAAEGFQAAGVKYYETFLPILLDGCTDPVPDIRQASAYGLGICAQYGGHSFKPIAGECINKLTAIVTQPTSRSPESEFATDNAISAIGKICELHPDAVNSAQILAGWLSYLPLKKDVEEAKLVHGQLCRLLEAGDPRLFGGAYENLPKILSILADIFTLGGSAVDEATLGRLQQLLKSMQQTINQEILTSSWNSLQPQQQAILQKNL